jgi:hypothetical protein
LSHSTFRAHDPLRCRPGIFPSTLPWWGVYDCDSLLPIPNTVSFLFVQPSAFRLFQQHVDIAFESVAKPVTHENSIDRQAHTSLPGALVHRLTCPNSSYPTGTHVRCCTSIPYRWLIVVDGLHLHDLAKCPRTHRLSSHYRFYSRLFFETREPHRARPHSIRQNKRLRTSYCPPLRATVNVEARVPAVWERAWTAQLLNSRYLPSKPSAFAVACESPSETPRGAGAWCCIPLVAKVESVLGGAVIGCAAHKRPFLNNGLETKFTR